MRNFHLISVLMSTLLVVFVTAASAQDETEEKDFLTSFLQDSLSGDGRIVDIVGFRGALSRTAALDSLTIADDDGVWLLLRDVELRWDRLATLAGRIEIESLTAAHIELSRLPDAQSTTAPETGEFALPELPVSINIGEISATNVVLGAPVLGQDATLAVTGELQLAGGAGAALLELSRLDGPEGIIDIDVGFSNQTGVLRTALNVTEDAGGLITTLLQLPGAPAIELQVAGEGPVSGFAATVALRSDGVDRLAGTVTITDDAAEGTSEDATEGTTENTTDDTAVTRDLTLALAGDMTPLFAPEFQHFFGPDVVLAGKLRLHGDGRKELSRLRVRSQALQIEGEVALRADNLPENFALDVLLSGDGTPVLLPVSGANTVVRQAELKLSYDRGTGDRWQLVGEIEDFHHDDIRLGHVTLSGQGTITDDESPNIDGALSLIVDGFHPGDAALARAIGDGFSLRANAQWSPDGPLDITRLALAGPDLRLEGHAKVSGVGNDLSITGSARFRSDDVARFSGLAGRPLGGGALVELHGEYAVLTGQFDVEATAKGTDLTLADPQIDPILSGASLLSVAASRGSEGIVLRRATAKTDVAQVEVDGKISSAGGRLTASAALDDLSRFVAGMKGPANVSVSGTGDPVGWNIEATATGPHGLDMFGSAAIPTRGPASATLNTRIATLGWLAPQFAGAARLSAKIRDDGDAYHVTAEAQGPQGATVDLSGRVARDFLGADLGLKGQVDLSVLNGKLQPRSVRGPVRFDLRLDGPLSVASLSGKARITNAHFALPNLQIAVADITGDIDLSHGTARVTAEAALAAGGRLAVRGTIGTAAPFQGDLVAQLSDGVLRYTRLLHTEASGEVTIRGPLTGGAMIAGQIDLGHTEVNLQAPGSGTAGALPEITHIAEPGTSHLTRKRAGLIRDAVRAGGGTPFGLDVAIEAKKQIYVRGLGVDSEFQGGIHLTGTTANIVPTGNFEMIRGRLSLVGRRFDFVDGDVWMQGSFMPNLFMQAEQNSRDGKLKIILEGAANNPEFRFESEPSRPSDEILALILFGRDLSQISALQAAQLASTLATLSGRGGSGFMEKLRQTTGIDDIDVTTNDKGETGLRVGKYLNDKLYTDVEVDSSGNTTINLNLDVTETLTVKGRYGSKRQNNTRAETGIGLYFQKDY